MMAERLKVAAIQLGSRSGDHREDTDKMVMLFERAVEQHPDIVCFPELMNVPYFCCTRDDRYFELAEALDGPTIKTFVDLSKKNDTHVIATLFEKKGSRYFNSAAFISPQEGVNGVYRKVHIPITDTPSFSADETYFFTPGKEFPVFDFGRTRIGILICFDRSFPEAFRILWLKGAQVVFVPAASCGFRGETFVDELKIRAMENSLFVVAVNKAGDEFLEGEAHKRRHFGKTCAINPSGQLIAKLEDEPNQILIAELELDQIQKAKDVIDWSKFRKPELYRIIGRKGID
jgi:beta-ureidopropionase